jgi:iron complex transport system substrate-binding protein
LEDSVRAPRPRRALALLVGVALTVAACGDDDDDTGPDDAAPTGAASSTDTGTETATTGSGPSGTEATDAADSSDARIISLSPTHTEVLFAIGAGDQIVAVDDQSDFPEEVAELPNDLSGFEPDVEAIASYEPDLVVIGGDFTGLVDQLASVGIESYDGPPAETVEDAYAQIEDLGGLTGQEEEAAALVEQMRADIDGIVADTDVPDEDLDYYHEVDPTLFSVTSNTFLGEIYALYGMTSIADELEADAGPFPQLTAEFLVDEDPDVIFVDDCCGETPESVAARPGWSGIDAVEDGQVFQVDDDLASRWGPRLVDYVAVVSEAVESAS